MQLETSGATEDHQKGVDSKHDTPVKQHRKNTEPFGAIRTSSGMVYSITKTPDKGNLETLDPEKEKYKTYTKEAEKNQTFKLKTMFENLENKKEKEISVSQRLETR